MKLLLDTHALIWALSAPGKLPKTVASAITSPSHTVYVSVASIWEIATKAALGKIKADPRAIATAAAATGFVELPVSMGHAVQVRSLAPHHRDPFDRILVAQAVEEGLSIVTHDRVFALYPVSRVWK